MINKERKDFLSSALKVLEALGDVHEYVQFEFAENQKGYALLGSDYSYTHNSMFGMMDTYETLKNKKIDSPDDAIIFHSVIGLYKRQSRTIMSRLCTFLDAEEGTKIFSDAYSTLIKTFEEFITYDDAPIELVNLFGVRISVLRDLLITRIPVCFGEFFFCEFEDLISVYTMELKYD